MHQILFVMLLSVANALAESGLRSNSFKENCPGKMPPEYVSKRSVTTKSKVQCAAMCQQDDTCTSMTYSANTCNLQTTYDVPCASRNDSSEKHLEKVDSSWCGHDGKMDNDNTTCSCVAGYGGQFCQIGKTIIVI